jgi:hypothetical protein
MAIMCLETQRLVFIEETFHSTLPGKHVMFLMKQSFLLQDNPQSHTEQVMMSVLGDTSVFHTFQEHSPARASPFEGQNSSIS